MFIDGLDEYESGRDREFGELIGLFTDLSSSPDIKIWLSSRPWLVFEDAFQSSPSLKLQDLTFNDIKRYIDDKVNKHLTMEQLRRVNPLEATELVQDLARKASGVFLWVMLVVRSLLAGLTNRDQVPDLQKRIALLPADLENLYQHILSNHIDPFYHERSARIFQIFCASAAAFRILSVLTLDFCLRERYESRFEFSNKPNWP